MRGGKSFLILLVVAVGVCGYAYFVESKNDPSFDSKREKVFKDIESEKIDQLTFKSGAETTTVKKDSGTWKMTAPQAYPVDVGEISIVTTALAGLEIEKVIDEKAPSLANYSLDPPRTSVTFHTTDGQTHTLDLGMKNPVGSDLYARADGGARVFLIGAYREDALNRTTFSLRDKTILTFDRDAADYLKIDDGKKPLVIAKKDNLWHISEPIDAAADFPTVDSLVGRLFQLRMKALTTDDGTKDLKPYGLDKPQYVVTIGAGSARSELAIGGKADDSTVYAREMTRPAVFTIESGLIDELKRVPSDYRLKDVFEFRAFTAVHLTITRGGQTYEFSRTAAAADNKPAEWKLDKPAGKALDTARANDMLTNFSNLKADSFVDALGPGEETVVTARFGDEKAPKEETVTFHLQPSKKAGENPTVHAQRKGEKGAMAISALDFDKAMAVFKELTGSK